MSQNKTTIQLCGFGGQGIVLSAVILGSAAVTKAGLYAVQTQSYGSEARGGECQSEVILSKEKIGAPTSDEIDVLAAMSQTAMDKYINRLKPGGYLVYDPEFVDPPARSDISVFSVPATQTAGNLGLKLAANMVMLGYLQQKLDLFSPEAFFSVIEENVPAKFTEINLDAARKGISLAETS
jgi:2-oxoglutarate ferredoxin oxidoreductase subunit gamma